MISSNGISHVMAESTIAGPVGTLLRDQKTNNIRRVGDGGTMEYGYRILINIRSGGDGIM
ncbi:hypothetical protein A2U01_0096904, partial [Trifolium medium]|nr:hypothetical protein [Trifolium medium]